MALLIKKISNKLNEALQRAYPELNEGVIITEATAEKFGHYQCNSALSLAKGLKRSPKEIADRIVSHIEDKEGLFEKVEVVSPGFINMTLSSKFLSRELNEIFKNLETLGIKKGPPKRIVIDFSSPNVAKEMHVGHLRSTIIGDSLARLFEFLGDDVVRLNHIGDWGTAFGMLIAYMKEHAPEVLSGKKTADLPQLMQWYRASKKCFDEDESFKERARKSVVALQSGDVDSLNAWKIICDISSKAYQEIYNLLDIKITDRGESFYNTMLPKLVEDLEKKGILTLSEGAKCVFIDGQTIPLMVQKADGGFGYDATDLAAMKHRVEIEKADRIIIVLDSGQTLHLELVYEAAVKAGYLDPKKVKFDHVAFGLVLGADGKKFKTRSGDVERLIDLLTTAVNEAKRILTERGVEHDDETALILGIDAIKYADLSSNRISDYMFSYERMLRFEGNTAPFILYSYVRVQGIKRKIKNFELKGTIEIKHPSEVSLGLHLLRFEETLRAMAEDLLPNYLTDYLYNLAQKFNIFFRDCRVEGSEEQQSRLLLSELTAQTLKKGLNILGLKTLEKM